MSFKKNENHQLTLNDTFISRSKRTQKMVQKSWASDFADIVFPAINEERFSVLYSDNKFSRPNTPVNVIVGALMLKEMNNLDDDELLQSICCDVRYQYALHTTSYDEQPVSDRTFSRFRERLYSYELESGKDLLGDEMRSLAEEYAKYMDLHRNVKRMDSLMVASRCKRMSRLEILYTVCANAVRLIHRLGMDELLSAPLLKYLDPDDHNDVIYYCKGDEVTGRLETEIAHAKELRSILSADEWHSHQEYQLLIRVINEQSMNPDDESSTPKEKKDISPESLQNPSDPDATYREKAGKGNKGYAANIVETTGADGCGLITDMSYATNGHADTSFTREYLEGREASSPAETVIVDGAYSSTELQKEAAEKNVTLVPTALTGKTPDPFMADFHLSEDGRTVISCPEGHAPVKSICYEKTGTIRSVFPQCCCENCPHRDKCRPKEQRKGYAVHISSKAVQRAEMVKEMSTDAYKQLSRLRNGVEGVMSVLRRRYDIDDIPVCGLLRSRAFFLLKVGAYNIVRLIRHRRKHTPGDNCALLGANA